LLDETRVESEINLQLTGKISIKLNSNSSLLLENGRKSIKGHYKEVGK